MKIIKVKVGKFRTNCYLLFQDNEILILDPGGEEGKILKKIKDLKGKVKYILATHYHPDHTFAIEKIRKKTGAKVLVSQKEKNFINFKADQFFNENDEIRLGKLTLKVIETPGHSKGSISILGKDFIFVGDLLFKEGIGRIDLPGGSEREIKNSLKKLKKILRPKMKIYPGHGEPFFLKI